MQLSPATQSASQSQAAAGHALQAMSLSAFPVTMAAFPVSLSAFPVSLSAFPVCDSKSSAIVVAGTKGGSAASCGDKVKLPKNGRIPDDTPNADLPGYQPVHLQAMYGIANIANSRGAGLTVAS
ncbi:MAG: hypothetical protein GIW95_01845 [Candidatus Eremiobacteraeota bacterium]|nr:hypothetical protein [Candidatus Eremiobacteraeota bacterium]